MNILIAMPEIAETVVEGTIGRWLKKPGDSVERYESIAEIITDKVNIELPSPAKGVLSDILIAEGQTVTVGTSIAVLISENETSVTEVSFIGDALDTTLTPEMEIQTATGKRVRNSTSGKRYSPLVRRIALEQGVDLTSIEGTGAGGRITKFDVLRAVKAISESNVLQSNSGLVDAGLEMTVDSVRRSIANRMMVSAQQIPHAWTMMEVDVSGLATLIKDHKNEFQSLHGYKLTYLPFFLEAVAATLKTFPIVNSSWQGDKILLKHEINLGIAVGRDDGLIVPVIRNVDQKSLFEIAKSATELVQKAHDNILTPDEVQGGTFTVSNIGAFGSVLSMPIINPPQAGIITCEAVVKRPVIIEEDIKIRSKMNICLSFDHRVFDGSQATSFLSGVKQRLEDITKMSPCRLYE